MSSAIRASISLFFLFVLLLVSLPFFVAYAQEDIGPPYSEPKIEISPTEVPEGGSPDSVKVTIGFGNSPVGLYKIYTGKGDESIRDTKAPAITVACVSKTECEVTSPEQLQIKNSIIENNVLSFDFITNNLTSDTYFIAIRDEGYWGGSGVRFSKSFTVRANIDEDLQVGLTLEPAKLDTKDTKKAKITASLAKPRPGTFKLLFNSDRYRIEPQFPEINCDTNNLASCSTSFTLPVEGLTTGSQSFQVIGKDASANDVIVGEATLEITGDPTQRPGLTCTGPKDNCIKSLPNLCDVSTGKKLEDPADGTAPIPVNEKVGYMTAIGCVPTHPLALISGMLRFFAAASGGIALLMMIYGSYQMIMSQGDAGELKKGREQFIAAVLGLLFVIFSVTIMQIIGVDILNLPGFKK